MLLGGMGGSVRLMILQYQHDYKKEVRESQSQCRDRLNEAVVITEAVIMGQWSFLSDLLDKVQSHSTVVGKVWMSVLFLFRIFILAAGVDKIWGDEQANMNCNTKSPGCKNACYDRTFPMSHTRFWVLQILIVSTPTLIYLGHVLLVIRSENKLRRRLEKKLGKNGMIKAPKYSNEQGKVQLKGVLLVSYLMQLMFKILLEVAFIVGQYYLYGFILMPNKISYPDYPCPAPVDCFISRPTEKTIFIVFMLAMAILSVILNIVEMLHLIVSKMREKKRRSSERRLTGKSRTFAFRLSSFFTTTRSGTFSRTDRITADAAPIRLSISRSIFPSLVNKTPRYLNSSTWRQDLSTHPERARHPFPVENQNHGLRFGGADSHPSRFTLGCKPLQYMLKVLV
ncbi:hypothetical protein L3Q82_001194 [Scortum barcoo]|uniref:Uncharacterized protein n=1 Tax=Scortum barcoo TaxID=214431 RepID=A0ACB8W8U7_9TELE|nr:hypothetical protein L3Q82_001194 [Scortum barcoo]